MVKASWRCGDLGLDGWSLERGKGGGEVGRLIAEAKGWTDLVDLAECAEA